MRFKEFCQHNKLTPEEKRLAALYLMAFRLAQMWDALMRGEDE